MKKIKKLTLRRETIQVLETDAMAVVAGGAEKTWNYTWCNGECTWHPPCPSCGTLTSL